MLVMVIFLSVLWDVLFALFHIFLNFASDKKGTLSVRWNKDFFVAKTMTVSRKFIRHLEQIVRRLIFCMCRVILTFLRAKNGEKIVEITLCGAISTF